MFRTGQFEAQESRRTGRPCHRSNARPCKESGEEKGGQKPPGREMPSDLQEQVRSRNKLARLTNFEKDSSAEKFLND